MGAAGYIFLLPLLLGTSGVFLGWGESWEGGFQPRRSCTGHGPWPSFSNKNSRGCLHIPPFLSLGTNEGEPETLLNSSKRLQPGQHACMDQGKGICVKLKRGHQFEKWARGVGAEGQVSEHISHVLLFFVGSLWAARSLIWHCLWQGGQRGAVALAGQHPQGLAAHLCSHPHLRAVGAHSGKLLPVSAGLASGRPIRGLGWLEPLGYGWTGVYLALPDTVHCALEVGPNVSCPSSQFNATTHKISGIFIFDNHLDWNGCLKSYSPVLLKSVSTQGDIPQGGPLPLEHATSSDHSGCTILSPCYSPQMTSSSSMI